MIFCLGSDKYDSEGEGYQKSYRIFNKDVSKDVFNKSNNAPSFTLPVSLWVKKDDMTKEEKKNKSGWEQMGGYLKTLSYKDAWAEAWPKASDEFKKWVKGLPNFNADLFEEITGQKIDTEISLRGKKVKVEIDGQSYSATLD